MSKKHKESHDEELPFVALMDTMTNVVGVLLIVLVVVGISLASSVKKILSELPPVTVEQLQEALQKVLDATPKEDPKKIAEEQKKLEEEISKANSDLKTLDLDPTTKKVVDIDASKKKMEEAKKQRDEQKAATEKMIAELDKLKALLDTTPVYVPPPPTVVRLPNPRPFPEKPLQVDYFVADSRLSTFVISDYIPPIEKGLEQIKSQLELKDVRPQAFEKLLQDILKDRARMGQAWQLIAPFAPHIQVEDLALAYDTLSKTGEPVTKDTLTACVNLAVGFKKSVPAMAAAMEAATKGDFLPWLAFRPPTEKPESPSFIGKAEGAKVTIGYTPKNQFEVKKTPKDILKAFEDVEKALDFKQKFRERTMFDQEKLKATIARAFESSAVPKDFVGEITNRPTASFVQIKFTPRPEAAETIEQAKQPNSRFRRGLATVKANPDGVIWFKVVKDSLNAYVQAREISEEMSIPAGWEIVNAFEASAELKGFEVQRTQVTPPKPPTPPPGVKIEPPKKTLD